MSERENLLRDFVERIQGGEDLEKLKKHYMSALGVINPAEISLYKEEWVKEGVSEKDIQVLIDMNFNFFRESVKNQKPIVQKGHPVFTLMAEHSLLLEYVNELASLITSMVKGERETKPEFLERIRQLIGFFEESETHYQREENALFPLIEKHGLTGPPSAMWTEHQEIHSLEKTLFEMKAKSNDELAKNLDKLHATSINLANMLASHFNKENSILFPASMRLLSKEEWDTVTQDFDDIGYCSYSVKPFRRGEPASPEKPTISENEIAFGSGKLSMGVLEAIFNHLPIDITFVDAHDRVQFFSESPDRIFVRSRAVIGRSVQLCHPKKSVHIVEEILNDFRSGNRDAAEFWINLGEKTIYIRYFAVRDVTGEYLGCLEVSQNITEILKITGEKRLLE